MGDNRIVILGCGRAGESLHLPAFQEMTSCEVLGVCDVDISRAQAVARKYGLKHACDSLQAALGVARPNIVSICSPPQTHFEAVKLAAEYGADIIVEKPVATTLRDLQVMIETTYRCGVRLCAVHNYHFAPSMTAGVEVVSSGRIGEIVGLSKIWTTNTSDRMMAEPGHWAKELVGGRWSEAMPHHIYQGLALLGCMDLVSVAVAGTKRHQGLPADDVHINFLSPCGFYTVDLAFSLDQRYGVLTIFGTTAQMAIGFDSVWLWDWKSRDAWVNLASNARNLPGHVKSGHRDFMEKAISYLRGDDECPVREDEVIRTVKLTEEVGVQMEYLSDRL